MVRNISWQSYWTVIALLSAGYYLLIYLLYFRKDFELSFYRKMHEGSEKIVPVAVPSLKEKEEYLFDSCLNELTAFFESAKARKWIKEELVHSLQRLFEKYAPLKNSSCEEALNKVVICQAEEICSIHLSAEDVVSVWLADR